jgi:hypothetical protein
VRQLFELEDFGPSQAVERFREMELKSNRSSRKPSPVPGGAATAYRSPRGLAVTATMT